MNNTKSTHYIEIFMVNKIHAVVYDSSRIANANVWQLHAT